MSIIGYVRAAKTGKSLSEQLQKMALCNKIFRDIDTEDNDRKTRQPALLACMEALREGDTLMVTRLDRLARSLGHLHYVARELKDRRINLKVVDQNIDTKDETGQMLFSMLTAIIGQFENGPRQKAGIEQARMNGVALGRKTSLSDEQINELVGRHASGDSARELAQVYGVSKRTIERYLKKVF